MRIVSQDKTRDLNYGNVCITLVENNIHASSPLFCAVIGNYKTEERALTVMAEIRDTWRTECYLGVYDIGHMNNVVYEMPKE